MLKRDLPAAWNSRSRLSSSAVHFLLLLLVKAWAPCWLAHGLGRWLETGRTEPFIDMARRLKLPCLAQQAFSLPSVRELRCLVSCLF